ncbi:DUF898 family protein [Marivita hallyeonensis]|uniref:DUF898 domain-containing protein n=1 Tax=Marivita hallyeonensis TaxID=996342 RepID=A0A1M5X013_9RHOB|nr:DUF898 family protein [Marivita hallyeonensis]SHH92774.1 protein of unknown function [Marivita hallyeonensis]
MTTELAGSRGALFWLALKTGLLTVLTLGFYRFWMKTRLRRWYWSAIRPGGHPLEYVGDPVEKLLGFLFAVVVLAFYIGIVNLILMFLSFSLFQDNFAAYTASLVGVIPLWFFAQYRARRYILARTRWRGLRFGLEPGAWGYAGRALWHWALTILTLGILWPRMTFWLEKYKTDRTFFGSARMNQGGRWQMLYPAIIPLVIAAVIGALGTASFNFGEPEVAAGLWVIAAMIALYGFVHYRVVTLRLLTNAKTVNGVSLALSPSPFRVTMIYVLGTLLAAAAVFLPLVILGLLLLTIQSADVLAEVGMEDIVAPIAGAGRYMIIGASVVIYFTIFLLWSALTNVFVTLPVVRHYFSTLTLSPQDGVANIRQRPRDEFAEAEGFADALDVGASL